MQGKKAGTECFERFLNALKKKIVKPRDSC